MNRRQRARVRLAARDYAYRYLNVQRLPNGVPGAINDWLRELDGPPFSYHELTMMLAPYRKPYVGL